MRMLSFQLGPLLVPRVTPKMLSASFREAVRHNPINAMHGNKLGMALAATKHVDKRLSHFGRARSGFSQGSTWSILPARDGQRGLRSGDRAYPRRHSHGA